jgi:drug/metabolite transporter (DMT)-like permease
MKSGYLYLIFAGILAGIIIFGGAVFSKLGLSLYEISFIPYAVAVIILLPFIFSIGKNRKELKKNFLWFIILGFIAAFADLSQFAGVVLGVPVAIAVLLLYTQPLWTVLLSRVFLKEKITWKKMISCVLVLIGIFLLANPIDEIKNLNWGIIISLLSGVFLSVWFIAGRFSGKKKISPLTTQFGNGLFCTIFLIIFYPIMLIFVKSPKIVSFSFNYSWQILIYLLIFAIISKIILHFLIFSGLRKVESGNAGIIMLLEPLSASILALIFLAQPLTWNIIIGGIVIILANYLIIRGDANNKGKK